MCISPLTIRKNYADMRQLPGDSDHTRIVPCGKCPECLGTRRNQWSFRLHHEMQISTSACFITLTYGINENFGNEPPTSFNGIYTLRKKDVQDFMKRLRKEQKKFTNDKIKYYAIGEYGTNNNRPHYHIIMFNLATNLIQNSLAVGQNIWTHGQIDISPCNIATINYVVGYIMPGKFMPTTDDDDRAPHFSLMSKRLGSSWLTDEVHEYHHERMETSVLHPSGFRIPMPRYYREQIFSAEERYELAELGHQIRKINWNQFINYDYKKERDIRKEKIRKHQKNLKTARTAL